VFLHPVRKLSKIGPQSNSPTPIESSEANTRKLVNTTARLSFRQFSRLAAAKSPNADLIITIMTNAATPTSPADDAC